VKAIARICQKRVQPEYIKQMGQRVYEKSIMSKAAYAIESRYIVASSDAATTKLSTTFVGFVGNSKFTIRRTKDRQTAYQWHGTTKGVSLHPMVMHWFKTKCRSNNNGYGRTIAGFTEFSGMDPSGNPFKVRAHPHYRGSASHEVGDAVPWHDWALIRFQIGDSTEGDGQDNEQHPYPAKILAFFKDLSVEDVGEQGRALIFCSNFQTETPQERKTNRSLTRLCERWEGWTDTHQSRTGIRYTPKLMDVPVTSIIKPIMVIEEDPCVLRESYASPPKFWVIRRRKKVGDEPGWEQFAWW